jgi:signal transduction histidine kinase
VRCKIIDANAAGLGLWWGTREALPLPQSLDAAMPALARLRCTTSASEPDLWQPLALWAPGGMLDVDAPATAVGHDLVAITLTAGDRAPSRGAKLAHELRTPLAAIAAYAEVMAQEHFGPVGDSRYRDYARIIHDSARHALGVIEGMMASASAATAPRPRPRELHFKDVDPAAIAESCLAVIAPSAHQAGVALELDCPPGLPRIVADEVSVRQMLLNLLTNAVKFARSGDRVRLGVAQGTDGGLTFAVEDTGPGMPTSREIGDARTAKGLGVGLPLTRELAEANGAALAIESEPGSGTRACISFSATRVVPAW